jgi:hypothetical protein
MGVTPADESPQLRRVELLVLPIACFAFVIYTRMRNPGSPPRGVLPAARVMRSTDT